MAGAIERRELADPRSWPWSFHCILKIRSGFSNGMLGAVPVAPFVMILEVAILDVLPGQEAEFQKAFGEAERFIGSAPGYVDHELKRCIEKPTRYILLVNWQRLEDHTEGFRKSPQYQDWKALLHHFYSPFPEVEHYRDLDD